MLLQAAGITVKDNRLGGNLHNVIDGLKTGRHIHQLNIRLSLCCGIAQGGYPHSIKLMHSALFAYSHLLSQQPGQATVGFNSSHQPLDIQQLFQPRTPAISHTQLGLGSALDFLILPIPGIRKLHQPSAIGCQHRNHLIPDRLLQSVLPIISMHNHIRPVAFQIVPVAQGLLLHHLVYACYVGKKSHSLCLGQQRKSLVAGYRLI